MKRAGSNRIILRSVLWALIALVVFMIATSFTVCQRLLQTRLIQSDGGHVINLILYQFLVGLYYALPATTLLFFGTIFHNPVADFRFSGKRFVMTGVFFVCGGFILGGFIHPKLMKLRTRELLYVVPVNSQRLQSEAGLQPDFMNIPELVNCKDDAAEKIYEIRKNIIDELMTQLTYAQIDSLLKDSSIPNMGFDIRDFSGITNIKTHQSYTSVINDIEQAYNDLTPYIQRYHKSDWLLKKMWLYPVTLAIMVLLGRLMGRRLRRLQFWLPALISGLIVFPVFVAGTSYTDRFIVMSKIHYMIGVYIIPGLFMLVLLLLALFRQKTVQYRLDYDFIDKHRHELHRFDELREKDEWG